MWPSQKSPTSCGHRADYSPFLQGALCELVPGWCFKTPWMPMWSRCIDWRRRQRRTKRRTQSSISSADEERPSTYNHGSQGERAGNQGGRIGSCENHFSARALRPGDRPAAAQGTAGWRWRTRHAHGPRQFQLWHAHWGLDTGSVAVWSTGLCALVRCVAVGTAGERPRREGREARSFYVARW